MRADLPTGTVTFLFTDVEGSTKLLHELGAETYAAALAEHRKVVREACAAEAGVEVDTQGDAVFVAFLTAPGALRAARQITERLDSSPIRLRMGLHTGTPLLTEEGYVGPDVHRAARIAAAASGTQIVVSASTRALSFDDDFRDLGRHRFKDLAAAEHVYQVGSGDFPPLRSLPETNLPVPATPFLGRKEELEAVVTHLVSPEVRLLTLTGAGGTGKTRLALQSAAEVAEAFPGGVSWVPLTPLTDASLVAPSVVQTLGAADAPEGRLDIAFAERTARGRTLGLLDNCEHLLPAVASPIAAIRDVPGVTVLATSRERLQLQGEQVFGVPTLSENDGAQLFLARAAAVGARISVTAEVEELCERLDNLPLALELAAARTVLFAPRQLLERLGERLDFLKGGRESDPRQQTLRATIEWSHDLLDDAERRLFRRLAVFRGGCSYEAAEVVCDADPDTLQSLLDKSLLRRREVESAPRYWMLETIREYALERLEESGEADVVRRSHGEHLAAKAEDANREAMYGGEVRAAMRWFREDQENLRAAVEWARKDTELLLRLLHAVRTYWEAAGFSREYRVAIEAALAAADALPQRVRARALANAGWIANAQHDGEAAIAYQQRSLELYRSLGDDEGVARSLVGIGRGLWDLGKTADARKAFEDALRTAQSADSTPVTLAPLTRWRHWPSRTQISTRFCDSPR